MNGQVPGSLIRALYAGAHVSAGIPGSASAVIGHTLRRATTTAPAGSLSLRSARQPGTSPARQTADVIRQGRPDAINPG
jgi:hypothetical protein